MGNKNKSHDNSRRGFFSTLLGGKVEKIKMLTPDGKLVEVDKSVVDKASANKKATNKEIFDWMKNPSKDKL